MVTTMFSLNEGSCEGEMYWEFVVHKIHNFTQRNYNILSTEIEVTIVKICTYFYKYTVGITNIGKTLICLICFYFKNVQPSSMIFLSV